MLMTLRFSLEVSEFKISMSMSPYTWLVLPSFMEFDDFLLGSSGWQVCMFSGTTVFSSTGKPSPPLIVIPVYIFALYRVDRPCSLGVLD